MTVDFYEILDEIVDKLKDSERTFRADKKKDKTPRFYPTYKDTVEVQEAIAIHSDYEKFPEKLFREKAPNETPPEFEYRKSIYQPITVPYFHKAMNVTGRVWNEQNYDIKWPENSEAQQDYFYKEYPYWGNLEAFFKQVVSPTTCTDPNAVIVHLPIDLAFTESGEFDDTREVTPIAELYDASRVWGFKHNKYAVLRAYEDADIQHYGRDYDDGIVLWMFDTDAIYKATQIGKKTDYKFDIQLYYQHNMGFLPCKRLGGIPVQDEDRFYYQSFFSPAIPALNIALCDSSTLAMSKYAHAFLQKWEYVDECDTCAGKGTESYIPEGFSEKVARVCSGCQGTGMQRMFSPLSVYQVKTPNGMASGGASKQEMNIPPAGFIELNPEILRFLEEQITTNLQRAFELLSIDVMNGEVSGRETATGKAIDREELYSFLLRFAECVFGTLEFSFKCIGTMRYGDGFLMPSIRYPQTFEIRTDAEITEELQKAPAYAQKMLALQYLDARFPIQDAKADRMKLAIKLDPLFGKTDTDIAKSVGVGATPKWKYALHNEVNYFIDLAIEANPNFMELEMAEQRRIVEELAKAAVPAETELTPDSILNQLS